MPSILVGHSETSTGEVEGERKTVASAQSTLHWQPVHSPQLAPVRT